MVQKTTLHLVVRVKFPVACTVTAELMLDYDVSYTIIIRVSSRNRGEVGIPPIIDMD